MKEILTFLVYSGISTILFLILLLSRKWQKRSANKILAAILLSFLALFLTYASSYLNNQLLITITSPIGFIIPFSLGPLLFYYIKATYNSKLNYNPLFHSLIPFAIAILCFSIPRYIFIESTPDTTSIFFIISLGIPIIGIIHFVYYLFLSTKLLQRFRLLVKDNYSSLNTLDLQWLSIWIKGFILFLLVDIVSGILIFLYPNLTHFIYINLFYLVILIWYIGYYGVNQVYVFLADTTLHNTPKTVLNTEEIHKQATFFNCKSEEFTLLKIRLDELFTTREFFKKEMLSLKETAEELNISDKKLSQLFNICLKTNFYEYVNVHRVNHFKKKIAQEDTQKFTLLAIAYDSGFNSKATFNRVFKQQVGLTPLQFKKQIGK